MPRFFFPVPSRHQTPDINIVSPPTLKVQRILGSGGINVDFHPHSLPDAAGSWGSRPLSGISVSVSENTSSNCASFENVDPPSDADEQHGRRIQRRCVDEDSEVLPRSQIGKNRLDPQKTSATADADMRSSADDSSLRRKKSSSTIASYYDKSKVPLFISQQTSNSAMAKGLPSNASSFLHGEGTSPESPVDSNKSPTLDLSKLFPGRKARKATASSPRSATSPLASPTFASHPSLPVQFPSGNSSTYLRAPTARPLTSRRSARNLLRPRTGKSQADQLVSKLIIAQPPASHAIPDTKQCDGIESLYEHYEQISLRDAHALDSRNVPTSNSGHAPPSMDKHQATNTDFETAKDLRLMLFQEDSPTHLKSAHDDFSVTSHDIHTSATGYSESIASRPQKPSETLQPPVPLLDLNRQEKSILSLSSDSEEDELDDSGEVSGAFLTPSLLNLSHDYESEDFGRPAMLLSGANTLMENPEDASWEPAPSKKGLESRSLLLPFSQLTTNLVPNPLAATTHRTASRQFSGSPSLKSRMSFLSTRTSNSFDRASFGLYEAHAVTIVPRQAAFYNDIPSPHSDSIISSQPTTPHSPTNVEVHPGSNRKAGFDLDANSILSDQSSGTDASGRSAAGTNSPDRFIAVTHEEEMLLAALRLRRARMHDPAVFGQRKPESKEATFSAGASQPQLPYNPPHPSQGSKASPHRSHLKHDKGGSVMSPEILCVKGAAHTTSNYGQSLPSDTFMLLARGAPEVNGGSNSKSDTGNFESNGQDYICVYLESPISPKTPFLSGSNGDDDSSSTKCGNDQSPDESDRMNSGNGNGPNSSSESSSKACRPSKAQETASETTTLLQSPKLWRQNEAGQDTLEANSSRQMENAIATSLPPTEGEAQLGTVDEFTDISLDQDMLDSSISDNEAGVPRPDSPPVETELSFRRRKPVRISAVGKVGIGADLGYEFR